MLRLFRRADEPGGELGVATPSEPPQTLTFTFDGQAIIGHPGESVAAALIANGIRSLRRSPRLDEPRGVYCGIGICFECLVIVDAGAKVRACMTPVVEGLEVRSGHWHSSQRDELAEGDKR
jgi:sarcosine oxidase subunit alpha